MRLKDSSISALYPIKKLRFGGSMIFKKIFLVLNFNFVVFRGFSTTYLPIPIERQIAESDAVIEGKFSGEIYKRLPVGDVVTQASFTGVKSSGLSSNEIVNPSDFKIYYPGGKWNGVVYHVYGSPKFEVGKEYVILLRKGEYGYFTSNLSLGKYDVKNNKDGERFIVSSVFPNHPELGKLNYLKLNRLLKKNFGTELTYDVPEQNISTEKDIAFENEEEGPVVRSPAADEKHEEFENNKSVILWHAVTLATLGVIASLYRRHDRKKR